MTPMKLARLEIRVSDPENPHQPANHYHTLLKPYRILRNPV